MGLSAAAIWRRLRRVARSPDHQVLGDAARDAGRWRDAALAYARHLAARPTDAAIRVQLGHAEKESGRLEAALVAYDRAAMSLPADVDLALHRADLRVRLGLAEAAAAALADLARTPDIQTMRPFEALVALGQAETARMLALDRIPPEGGAGRLLLGVGDLVSYMAAHTRPSGMQRVQIEILRRARTRWPGATPTLVMPGGLPANVPWNAVERLIAATDAADAPDDAAATVVRAAHPVGVTPDDVFVELGGFWTTPGFDALMAALGQRGVRRGLLLHDMIPLTNPEFAGDGVPEAFSRAWDALAPNLEFVVAVSDQTAAEALRRLTCAGRVTPVATMRLADVSASGPEPDDAEGWLRTRGIGDDFALCVGTIEARKNHALLFRLWRRWTDRNPAPTLVLAGRIGWRVGDLMAQLRSTDFLGGKIVLVDQPTQGELALLHRRCRCTIAPSLAEGWGLTIGESLAAGAPCAAARDLPAARAAAPFLELFDPDDVSDAERAIGRLLFDAEARESRVAQIRATFAPVTWDAAADGFFDAVARLAGAR